jgi:excisionase family DNA binding protein
VSDTNHRHETTQDRCEDWLTVRDLRRELHLGEKAVYRALKSGDIPSVRVGGVYRVHRKQLERALLGDAVA